MFDCQSRHDRNEARIATPRPGDYWHEMFCPYFVVVAVDGDDIVICDKTLDVDDSHWTWDLHRCRYATKAELRRRVTYETMPDKFVADCADGRHEWVIDAERIVQGRPRTYADLYETD